MASRKALHGALALFLTGALVAPPAVARPAAPPRLLPLVVSTAGRPKLVILPVGTDAEARGTIGALDHAAEQVALRSGRFELVRLVDALDPEGTRARAARAAEGDAALAAAQQSYDDLDAQKASVQFGEAVKAFRQADLTRRFADLSRAWVMKIASLAANGETKAAHAELDRLLQVDPKAQLSPNHFRPDTLAYAEQVRRALARASGSFQVTTSPPGAQVFVDGQYRGVAPVRVTGAAGEHLVTAVLPGYGIGQQAGSGQVELTLRPASGERQLQDASERISRDPEGPRRDAAARELATSVGADQVLLLLAKKSLAGQRLEVKAVRIDASDGHNLGYASTELAMESIGRAADGMLSAVLEADEPRRGGPVTHFGQAAVAAAGSSRKTIGYVLLGAGAALLGGGAFFGVQAANTNSAYRKTPQTDPARTDLESRGRGQALVADLGMLAGALSAVGGGVLAFTGIGAGPAPTDDARARADPPMPAPPSTALVEPDPAPGSGSSRTELRSLEDPGKKDDGKARDDGKRRKDRKDDRKKRTEESEDDLRNF